MSWNKFTSAGKRGVFAIILFCCLLVSYGCSIPDLSSPSLPDFDLPLIGDLGDDLEEVSPPELIQSLKAELSTSKPHVLIVEPQDQETLKVASAAVKLSLSGMKLFKDEELGLGPHIAVILDDREPLEVFDVSQPIHFDDLRPGTHTVRAIAEYPWHESFKNDDAYAQVSFNILTSSQSDAPGKLPILTTSSIADSYTDEPILLDFVVRSAQSEALDRQSAHVKVSVNDESFVVDDANGNIYLSGLKTGTNWVKLELQDASGHLSQAPYSEQLFGFDFTPDQASTLGDLLAEKVNFDAVGGVVGIAKPQPPAPSTAPKTTSTTPAVKPDEPASSLTTPTKSLTESNPASASKSNVNSLKPPVPQAQKPPQLTQPTASTSTKLSNPKTMVSEDVKKGESIDSGVISKPASEAGTQGVPNAHQPSSGG